MDLFIRYTKIFFFSLLVVIVSFFQVQFPIVQAQSASSSVSSSSSSSTQSAKAFSIKITKGTQSIFDNSLPVSVEVTSGENGDRLEMELSFSNSKLTSTQTAKRTFTSIKANDTKVFEYNLIPNASGDTTAIFKAQLWQNDVNIIQIDSLNLTFDNSLQIVPQTDDYKQNLKNWNTLKLFGLVLLLIVLIFLGYLVYKSTKVWLSKD